MKRSRPACGRYCFPIDIATRRSEGGGPREVGRVKQLTRSSVAEANATTAVAARRAQEARTMMLLLESFLF